MLNRISTLSVLMIIFMYASSCDQQEEIAAEIETTLTEEEPKASKYDKQHPYGGWFCPDNLGGFPPMDIQDLGDLAVVSDRLPTKEETNNGTSLMYFDLTEYPDARPLDIDLPRVASHYSKHNEMNELIIVIQAAVVGDDTIVGFRFPSGGNGSAWLGEVSFLSDKETGKIGASPFVYLKTELNSSKKQIWKAISNTTYARKLAEQFNEKEFFESEWTDESRARLSYESDSEKASGIAMDFWGNLYMQVDYDMNGFHFAEKLLVIENAEDNTSELHLVSGPYPEDLKTQQTVWKNWLQKVKELSEGS